MPSVTCPAVLIAAPASGQGKTTVTAALARLHRRAGRRVRVFKCGPDFLDPYWHELASGAPVYQLDLWINGYADCAARLAEAAQDCDLIIVEGVMGLYDGDPSAARLSQVFNLPVLTVIDGSAMATTFGALALGLQHYQSLRWAGVLANRVAGERHARMLADSLRDPDHWLGALPRDAAYNLPERHLGLVAAAEVGDAAARLDAAADALAQTPLGRMDRSDLARWNVSFERAPQAPAVPSPAPLNGRVIAVARDAAFCFIYAANLDCLRTLGAQIEFFSPLTDSDLPACDAIWLPGGYPELHAATLAANKALRDALADHVARGRPIWAECGGMMPLFDQLTTSDGHVYAMWGLLPGHVRMQRQLAALGPQQLVLDEGVLRGHTFHYSRCETPLLVSERTSRPDQPPKADEGEPFYRHGSINASYFHPWFASSPEATLALFGLSEDRR